MTDELTEAARRITTTANEGPSVAYLGHGLGWTDAYHADANTLARAWLAERDPEPPTWDDLPSFGFTDPVWCGFGYRHLNHPQCRLTAREYDSGPGIVWYFNNDAVPLPTRGHVLTLLRALGTQGVPR